MSPRSPLRRPVEILQEFSLPLILGVLGALVWANLDPHGYHHWLHAQPAHEPLPRRAIDAARSRSGSDRAGVARTLIAQVELRVACIRFAGNFP